MRFVTIGKFCSETGFTQLSVHRRIKVGEWREGLHLRRTPDGQTLIDIEAVERWIEGRDVSARQAAAKPTAAAHPTEGAAQSDSARRAAPTKVAYTVHEAAAAVGVSRPQIYRMIRAGELSKFTWAGRTLIRADVLQAAIDRASSRRAPS